MAYRKTKNLKCEDCFHQYESKDNVVQYLCGMAPPKHISHNQWGRWRQAQINKMGGKKCGDYVNRELMTEMMVGIHTERQEELQVDTKRIWK
jgi:hypothetical protein